MTDKTENIDVQKLQRLNPNRIQFGFGIIQAVNNLEGIKTISPVVQKSLNSKYKLNDKLMNASTPAPSQESEERQAVADLNNMSLSEDQERTKPIDEFDETLIDDNSDLNFDAELIQPGGTPVATKENEQKSDETLVNSPQKQDNEDLKIEVDVLPQDQGASSLDVGAASFTPGKNVFQHDLKDRLFIKSTKHNVTIYTFAKIIIKDDEDCKAIRTDIASEIHENRVVDVSNMADIYIDITIKEASRYVDTFPGVTLTRALILEFYKELPRCARYLSPNNDLDNAFENLMTPLDVIKNNIESSIASCSEVVKCHTVAVAHQKIIYDKLSRSTQLKWNHPKFESDTWQKVAIASCMAFLMDSFLSYGSIFEDMRSMFQTTMDREDEYRKEIIATRTIAQDLKNLCELQRKGYAQFCTASANMENSIATFKKAQLGALEGDYKVPIIPAQAKSLLNAEEEDLDIYGTVMSFMNTKQILDKDAEFIISTYVAKNYAPILNAIRAREKERGNWTEAQIAAFIWMIFTHDPICVICPKLEPILDAPDTQHKLIAIFQAVKPKPSLEAGASYVRPGVVERHLSNATLIGDPQPEVSASKVFFMDGSVDAPMPWDQ